MKGKFIIISLLILLLAFTVYKMMEFESEIRQERTIRLYVEDESRPLLAQFSDEDIIDAAANSDYYFAARGDYFKMLKIRYLYDERQTYWENIFIKGVNLGVAVPGNFPAEFTLTYSEYLEWLKLIGGMNANIIRTYTILPPEFYEALSYYNLHHRDKPLYLIQGVWAKVPDNDNYYDVDYAREFQKEIIDVMDVIHGNAVLAKQTGKASGTYATDVSAYVAALLLGREWEPGAVFKTNQLNKTTHFNGDFISMNDGNAMEAWLAGMMDFAVLYETQTYQFQHPVSFVNWLPLDPMYHNTEIIENKKVREYDNDLEDIDFRKFHATELFPPGIYAAYHAYPYYPDFIYLQESYRNSPNNENIKDPYFGYLEDLKQHTQGMPLIIAEYGLPSSRGSSHHSPYGFHQGGLSESQQATLSLALTKDIVNSRCGGAIYFAWIDEWFKHNWLVMDFEQPFDDRKLWHNMENPEQNFGIYAMESRTKTIDGDLSDWDADDFEAGKLKMRSAADPGYFYMSAILPGFNFKTHNLYVAIDTYDEEKGDHRLPFSNKEFDRGFEFLLQFISQDSALILVDEPYSVFTDIYNDMTPVYASKKNNNGNYIHQLMLTNRGREGLLGKKTDSVIIDRSPLIFGNSSDPDFSNADWYFNDTDHTIEIRLGWHLINVSDPAKRYVLDDIAGTKGVEYSKTDAVHIYAFITDKNRHVIQQYPEGEPYSFIWDEWQMPEYNRRLKPVYYTLQEYFNELSVGHDRNIKQEETEEVLSICDYYNDKEGAISISFDNAGFSQYMYAWPILKKYGFKATFGIIPELLDEIPGLYELNENVKLKRLGISQVKELAGNNEIAFQVHDLDPVGHGEVLSLEHQSGTEIRTLHSNGTTLNKLAQKAFMFVRGPSGVEPLLRSEHKGVGYTVSSSDISQLKLDSLIHTQKNKWTILLYHHLFDDEKEIPSKISDGKRSEFFINRSDFEKQIRLVRNSNHWISTESNVFKYLKEKSESSIQLTQFQDILFLKIVNELDISKFNHPLTLSYKTNAKTIRIKGSESDGTYSNRTGCIQFNALPNKEITIEVIE
ncbi:MAG: hypothetical protein ABFS05_00745 [Bacteroidota bacterium]